MRVRAKSEEIAKHIQHRPTGIKFRDGVADWPYDQFTKRRIRDGDVELLNEHKKHCAREQDVIIRPAEQDARPAAEGAPAAS